jgi:hypothetical protein
MKKIVVALALAASACLAADHRAHEADAPVPNLRGEAPWTAADGTRMRGGADVWFSLRLLGWRSVGLRDGDVVQRGDRLQALVTTRHDGHLYLAYCNAARELSWFPERASIAVSTGDLAVAPSADSWIAFDDRTGSESLYVVFSRRELAAADPALAAAVARSRERADARGDCGAALELPEDSPEAALDVDPVVAPEVPTGGTKKPKQAAGSTATVRPPTQPAREPPRPVGLARGAYIESGTPDQIAVVLDDHGIAIVRYRFTHVARSDRR